MGLENWEWGEETSDGLHWGVCGKESTKGHAKDPTKVGTFLVTSSMFLDKVLS